MIEHPRGFVWTMCGAAGCRASIELAQCATEAVLPQRAALLDHWRVSPSCRGAPVMGRWKPWRPEYGYFESLAYVRAVERYHP